MTQMFTAISRKVVGKNVQRQSRKVIWDMINTLFLTTVAVDPTYCFPLALANTFPWPFVPILSNFFEKKENSKPHTMPFRIVASTFPDNLSRNSCIHGYSLLRPQTYLRSSLTRVLKLCRLKQIKSIDVDKV